MPAIPTERPQPALRTTSSQACPHALKPSPHHHTHSLGLGHMKVHGNERADSLAKAVADQIPRLPFGTSLTWLKKQVKETAFLNWLDEWETSRHGSSLQCTPRCCMDAIYHTVKRLTSQILQLRTGQSYFCSYLYGKVSHKFYTDICPCRQDCQTHNHICPSYRQFFMQCNFLQRSMEMTLMTH